MSTVPWLNETEMRLWRGFIEVSSRVLQNLEASLKQNFGLTLDDYEVLVHLSEADEQKMRMSDLSERLLHSQSRLSQRIDRLVKRNFVARERCTSDGRVIFATLTEVGLAAIVQAAPRHVLDVRRQLIDEIPEDKLEMLATAFEGIAEASRTSSNVNAITSQP